MTDEQINVAIAEACGWTDIRNSGIWHNFAPWGLPPQVKSLKETSSDYISVPNFVPHYCTDLNAMHEAEKVLDTVHSWNGEEHHWNAEEAYMGHLTDITARDSGQKNSDDWQLVCATARQRAEAFLRTLGKWDQSGERTEKEVQK